MKISSNSWKSYIKNLSKIDKKAAETVSNYYREHPDLSVEQLISYCLAVSDYYGSAAGELACEMYEEVAVASGRLVPTPEPAPTATYSEMAKTVQGVLAQSQNPDSVGAAVGRKVKTVGLDTILKNSLRDGAQFAWIPSGDTCAFCMMLASNGWQRASKKALKNGHASHVHNNCDCSYAVRFDDNTEVEGYDPDYYRDIYDNAEGDTWEQKTNYIRRKNYTANKDKINEQKRIAYAERVGKYNDVKTKQEATSYLKGKLGFISAKLQGMSIGSINDVNRALTRIYKDYPNLKGFVQKIKVDSSNKGVATFAIGYDKGKITTELLLNPSDLSDRASIKALIKNNVKAGYWTPKDGVEGILRHEMGHAIEAYRAFFEQGVDPFSTDINDIYDRYFAYKRYGKHEIAERELTKAFASNNIALTEDNIEIYIAGYAREHYEQNGHLGEAFAESVSDWKPHNVTKSLQEAIKGW